VKICETNKTIDWHHVKPFDREKSQNFRHFAAEIPTNSPMAAAH
jgi:hypothetical protein